MTSFSQNKEIKEGQDTIKMIHKVFEEMKLGVTVIKPNLMPKKEAVDEISNLA